MSDSFDIQAKTLFGLEGVLAGELAALGAREITLGNRIVSFQGDQRLLYRANLWCRTAIRILKPIGRFTASSEKELYGGIRRIDWRQYLDADASLAIDPVVHNSFCTHSLYAAQLAKDAIVDQFRERCGKRPSVDLVDPDLRINLYMNQNEVTVHLDSSGDSLHKRGYRTEASEAPINEVLAAGIILLTGWDRATPLVDPMCGSGTFVIEAARLARNIAPAILRRFAFERWKDYDRRLHSEIDREAREAEGEPLSFEIVGSDRDLRVTEIARQNLRNAGIALDVRIETAEFAELEPPAPGVLVMNPPYGERLKVAAIADLYRKIGDTLKHNFAGYTAHIFTGNQEAAKHVGLRTSQRITLFNGPIECRLLRYEIRAPEVNGSAHVDQLRDDNQVPSTEYPVLSTEYGEQSTEHRVPSAAGDVGEHEVLWTEPQLTSPATPQIGPHPPSNSPDANLCASDQPEVPGIPLRTAGVSYPPKWLEQSGIFTNRLRRMSRHWKKWARRQGITCFRVYDRDIPEIPLSIDLYNNRLHIAEFERPHDRSEAEHERWLWLMVETARSILQVAEEHVYFKQRRRQRGRSQYSRQATTGEFMEVSEGGHRFLVNLADYLDTGLFLDHRITRSMVQNEAAGKRFLNLFAYTGSFTVYAAAGGAASTTSVDLSANYLDWARRNMVLNGLTGLQHEFVCDDVFTFLTTANRPVEGRYELAVVDPPTFSNSKSLPHDFDVERDHVRLLDLVLAQVCPGGKVYFSTSCRKFRLHEKEIRGAIVRAITGQTIPLDFQRKRPHRTWLLTRSDESHRVVERNAP